LVDIFLNAIKFKLLKCNQAYVDSSIAKLHTHGNRLLLNHATNLLGYTVSEKAYSLDETITNYFVVWVLQMVFCVLTITVERNE